MSEEYLKEYSKDFLLKAKRFLEIAKLNLDKYPEEAAFNATQAIINANDAFTIFVLGRKATKDHREAIILHKEAIKKIGDSSKLPIVQLSLESREATGYDIKKRIGKQNSEILIKKAERFIDWAESILK
jgi:HEPN domain-containing protein